MSIRKISKILLRIVLSLFVIFLLAYLLIQLPPVQTYVVRQITSNLSATLGAKVEIAQVRLKFFKTASLKNVLISDQSQDTLLFADEIDASIALFSFLNRRLDFDEITFSKTNLSLNRAKEDPNFNYQFIIDYLSSSDTSSGTGWNFDLRKIRLYNSILRFNDDHTDQNILFDIGVFSTYLNKLDINNKLIDIEQIGLGDSYLSIEASAVSDVPDSGSARLTFPNTGWTFNIKQVRLDATDLIYHLKDTQKENFLNLKDLNITNLSLFIDDLIWKEDTLSASLSQTTFEDHSGFILDQLSGDLAMSPQSIYINNLHIKTPHSTVNNETQLSISGFDKIRHFTDSVYLEAKFNETKIDLADLKLLIRDFDQIPYLNPDINEQLQISGSATGYLNDLALSKFVLRSNGLLAINLDGTIKQITNAKKLHYQINLHHLNTSYKSIKRLTRNIKIPTGLEDWNDFKVNGKFSVNLNNIRGRDVSLLTSSVTKFIGDFEITDLGKFPNTTFDVHFEDLRSVSDDLKGFSQKRLPSGLDSLGQFYYQGDFAGTIHNFTLKGRLSSDAGSLRTDLALDFDKDYKDARYNGDLALDSFNLGKVLAIDELGYLTMAINVFGNGLNSETLRATVLGQVKDLAYNEFHYHDLVIDGRFDKRQFAGHASIDDPNIAFNFEGVVNLNDSLSRYRFKADVDTIDFNALGFMTTKLGFSGAIESDFRGTFPDNIKGSISANNLEFSNLSEKYKMDSLLILSDFTSIKNRSLEIRSDLVQAQMQGTFTLKDIGLYLKQYVNHYFPLDIRKIKNDTIQLTSIDTLENTYADQDFNFDLKVVHSDDLLGMVIPEVELIDTLLLSGTVRSQENYLQLHGYANRIEYNGMSFGPITFTSSGNKESVDNVVRIKNTHLAVGVEFPFITFDLTMGNDSAYMGLLIEDASDTIQEKLNLAALITKKDRYHLTLNDIMVLNGKDWQVNPFHKIYFGDGKFQISDLNFQKDDQLLAIETKQTGTDQDILSAFNFQFRNFQLSEVSQLLEVEHAFYEGDVNGNFTLNNTKDKVNYLADLTLSDLTLRGERIGNLVIKSQQRTRDLLDVLVKLDGGISGLDIRGTYNRTTSALDIQGEIDQLTVKDLDPFLKNYIKDSRGKMSGLIKIGGTSNVPVIDGNFELENVSTFINYLQTRYTFVNEDIAINQNKIRFSDFTILDPNNNKATINGVADFKSISDPTLNLKFNTSRFLVLNTPANNKDFFYGKLFVKADVDISGNLSHPILQVNATSLDSTDFVLQPLVSEVDIQQEEFIIFANPEDYREDTTVSLQDFYKDSGYNIDISANIETTPDAQLTIVIDPATGDKLVCRGNGNLAIEIAPTGEPNILGSYIISSGQYAFNFQRVLKRTFEIDPGSRMDFVGNIFKSKFDVTASYGVRTSTYELIKNQSSLNPSEESRSRQRSEVDVKLKLTGTLERPIAKFDIEVKEQSGASQTSTVASKLSQLREDETLMNKQVFGLLIFSSFIAEEQSSNTSLLADASQSVLLSSVSNLLSNELNRLARRYIKGVDLDFGVNSYSANIEQGSSLITELKVGLSKRLLNDRLTIKLGGNVQFENNDNVDLVNNQNSTFSGDFVLEYKLTPDGNYNLKFFQVLSNEETIFNPGVNYSETGVSVFFTKSFNSKKYQLQLDE